MTRDFLTQTFTQIQLPPRGSSNIKGIWVSPVLEGSWYPEGDDTPVKYHGYQLVLEFVNGRTYVYHDVQQKLIEDLIAVCESDDGSVGSFVSKSGLYKYQKGRQVEITLE